MQLNKEQQAIVEAEPKLKTCLRILAGGGSGKSTTCTYKVKYMIEHFKIQPNKILLITFSNRAARDLRKKIKNNIGLSGKKSPTVSTIHGMCLDILKRFATEELTVISSWEDLLIFRNALEAYFGMTDAKKKFTTAATLNIIEVLSELYSTYNFDKFKDSLDTYMYDNSSMFEDFNDPNIISYTCRDFYEIVGIADRYKIANNLLSFDDIVYKAFELLTSDDEAKDWARKQWPYLFVDESQDCSAIQHLFYYNIFNTSHVVLVGDLVQEIYQFRHSDSRYLEEENLFQAFNEVTTHLLTYNFRSSHPVVTLGNMLREYAKSEIIQKPADFTKSLPKRVFIQKVKNQVTEGKTISKHIKELIKQGAEPKDIAVITRTNKYITTILEPALLETGLPYIIQGSKTRKLTDKSEILYIVHCLQLMVASPKAQIFILKQLIENVQSIGPVTAKKVIENLNGNIWNIIDFNDKKCESLSVLIKFIQDCSFNGLDVSKIGYYVDTFIELSKFDLKQQYVAEIKQLFSNWAEIYIEDTGKTLEQIIPEIQTSLDSVEEENVNAIKLASVHSQKGLEHKHVVCSGFTYKSQKMAKPTVEELNIMYVAFSRAIESLLVVHSDIITYMGEEITGYKQKWLKKLLQDLEN